MDCKCKQVSLVNGSKTVYLAHIFVITFTGISDWMAIAGRTGGLISLLSSSGRLWTRRNPVKIVISKPMIMKFGRNNLWILFIRTLWKKFIKYFVFESYLTISKVKLRNPELFQDGVGGLVQRSFWGPVVRSVWFRGIAYLSAYLACVRTPFCVTGTHHLLTDDRWQVPTVAVVHDGHLGLIEQMRSAPTVRRCTPSAHPAHLPYLRRPWTW